MTDTNLTHIYFLLDRSGSMSSIRDETVKGFDAFIEGQRAAPGRCRVTLAQFDHEYEEVYVDIPVAEVGGLGLEPRGSTALLDSIARLVHTAGARLAALPEHERPASVIVGIMTDGYENASTEYRHADIKALVERQIRDYSWQFLYLGADQDAIEVGAQIGVDADHAITYGRASVAPAMAATSESMRRYRSARAAGTDHADALAVSAFTDEERRRSRDPGG